MSQSISARIPDSLAEKLRVAAKATERKPSYFIQKALERYFEDEFDYQLARDRLLDKTDRIMSLEETKQELGI